MNIRQLTRVASERVKLHLHFGFSGSFTTELHHHFKFPLKYGFKLSFGLKRKLRSRF